jgi:hypothetical protein
VLCAGKPLRQKLRPDFHSLLIHRIKIHADFLSKFTFSSLTFSIQSSVPLLLGPHFCIDSTLQHSVLNMISRYCINSSMESALPVYHNSVDEYGNHKEDQEIIDLSNSVKQTKSDMKKSPSNSLKDYEEIIDLTSGEDGQPELFYPKNPNSETTQSTHSSFTIFPENLVKDPKYNQAIDDLSLQKEGDQLNILLLKSRILYNGGKLLIPTFINTVKVVILAHSL